MKKNAKDSGKFILSYADFASLLPNCLLRHRVGRELDLCADTARRAQAAGMGVNAGHDLSQANLADFLRHVPNVLEVSIGHALFDEALYEGLDATVRNYLRVIASVS